MGIFDMFKPKWSPGEMTQDDRKQLFWYLKRKTSYTAWKRKADAFDRFAAIFEKQVREEPHAPGLMDGTHWDHFYPEVLRAQVLYEKGLERLKQGNRTVWLYNSLGILDDAAMISDDWHIELVNHGMRDDHFFFGKYVDDMTKAIQEYFDATQDAGYLQPMMADTPAPEIWSPLQRELFAKLSSPIPPISSLPDVPEPDSEIFVRTNEEVPVFGIYEPQIKDGGMNYLLAGTPAPKVWEIDGDYTTGKKLNVVWRLIWEDTRYLDGEIPEEERHYFPEPQPVAAPDVVPHAPLSANTGQTCPRSGRWVVLDDAQGRATFQQGDVLSQHNGRDVVWVFVDL